VEGLFKSQNYRENNNRSEVSFWGWCVAMYYREFIPHCM